MLSGIEQTGNMVMRIPTNRKSALRVPVMMIAISMLVSCSGSTGPQWEDAGIHQVRVFRLDVEETIASDDTLSILLWGDTQPSGRLSLSEIEAVRESSGLELTVWAEVERWVGSGTVPPYDNTIRCNYQASPPFNAGNFRLVIHQPDGSQLVDSVLVEP